MKKPSCVDSCDNTPVEQAAGLLGGATEPVAPRVWDKPLACREGDRAGRATSAEQAAGLLGESFYHSLRYFNPRTEITNKSRNLPHWRQSGVTYFITFRLADSLPMEKPREIDFLMTQADTEDSSTFMPKLEKWLDPGHGECLRHFDGQRNDLLAWVVMPNHVHVLVKSLEGFAIDKVLHTWKSSTAHEINKLLGRSGQLWQTESYDHIVRDPQSVWSIANYIVTNPAKARYQTSFVASRVPNT